MTRWVAVFEDHPAEIGGCIRRDHDRAHFEYLAKHADTIRIGGGLRDNPGEWFVGGLWIIDGVTREEAVRLCEEDPYFKLGLRKSYRLYAWGKAPCYGDVVL